MPSKQKPKSAASKLIEARKDLHVLRDSAAHRRLALKAAFTAEKVLPLFEKEHPNDRSPRKAIQALRDWANGKRRLSMSEVRRLSLDSHAAARKAKNDSARFSARAAGQAVAAWHVPTHALGAEWYAKRAKKAAR